MRTSKLLKISVDMVNKNWQGQKAIGMGDQCTIGSVPGGAWRLHGLRDILLLSHGVLHLQHDLPQQRRQFADVLACQPYEVAVRLIVRGQGALVAHFSVHQPFVIDSLHKNSILSLALKYLYP